MQDVLPLEAEPRETKPNSLQKFVISGLSFLCWASPFIGLSIFLPMGVLVLYPQNTKIRVAAFQSLLLQIFVNLVTYPMDLYGMYSFETEAFLQAFRNQYLGVMILFWAFVGLILLFLEARFLIRKNGQLYLFNEKPTRPLKKTKPSEDDAIKKWEDYQYHTLSQNTNSNSTPEIVKPPEFSNQQNSFSKTFISVMIVWVIAIFWFFCLSYFFISLNTKENTLEETLSMADQMFRGESSLYLWFMTLLSASSLLGRKGILSSLRRPYLSLQIHTRLASNPTTNFFGDSFHSKKRYARIRELLIPGWGHVYLQRYWKGFPILFTYLLVLFFLAVSLAFYLDTIFGIKFLSSFGLKPGIPDKEFMQYADNPVFAIGLFTILSGIYLVANIMLGSSIKKDGEPFSDRGLQSGFTNNVYLSILAHLILFAIIFIIPITVQRQSSKKKQDMSKNHYQPEKMEYYFIDPDIPDEVKDLNGGVISGTETPSQKDGIKIPNNPVEDEGKVKGYVKRVKGKKLPRTYSNYISARMRGPENFMEYWKRAPHPYSCVVAYTITTEGDIIDVILVEGSAYPDQDALTLELIQSMSPVMPPPNTKGDVRVTELFWNGSIDPDAMPTPLQKDMVLHFDGRFMEEEF